MCTNLYKDLHSKALLRNFNTCIKMQQQQQINFKSYTHKLIRQNFSSQLQVLLQSDIIARFMNECAFYH